MWLLDLKFGLIVKKIVSVMIFILIKISKRILDMLEKVSLLWRKLKLVCINFLVDLYDNYVGSFFW